MSIWWVSVNAEHNFFEDLGSWYEILIRILDSFLNRSIYIIPDIGLGVRVFANGPGDLGSIPGCVIPKTQKMVLDASLLNTQHYKVRIKGKVEQSREGVAPSPTPWCSSYRKGSLRVTLDYGRQLYFTYIMIDCCYKKNLKRFTSHLILWHLVKSMHLLLYSLIKWLCKF